LGTHKVNCVGFIYEFTKMKCPVCRATYRVTESTALAKPCHRCGADLAPLIQLHDRAIAHHRQAIEQFTAGDLPAAMMANDKAISLHAQNSDFHAFGGQLFAITGEFEKAVRSWQVAQKLDPKNTLVSNYLETFERIRIGD
jgi:Tfp pilus assembly protein PilF